MVSSVPGLSVMRAVIASTSILSQATSGNSRATLGCDLIPHDHSVALGIGFRNNSQDFARTGACQCEGESHDAGHANPPVDGNFRADFLGQATLRASALSGVFPLGIFAHDHPIEILRGDSPHGTLDARKNSCGPHVGVLVEALASILHTCSNQINCACATNPWLVVKPHAAGGNDVVEIALCPQRRAFGLGLEAIVIFGSPGLVSSSLSGVIIRGSLGGVDEASDSEVRNGAAFFPNDHAEFTILGSLHPRMPKKSVIIRAMAFCWFVDVCHRNEAVSREFLY